MANPAHEKFCKMLEKTNIKYESTEIPKKLEANNISNPTQISSFLRTLIPVCKDDKFQMNTMRNKKSRQDILSKILDKERGIIANLKKIKPDRKSKELNAPAFGKISDEIKKIENYDMLKLDIGARENLKGLIENYLLSKKATTDALGKIKLDLAKLEKSQS